MSALGKEVARYKWAKPEHTWNQVEAHWPDETLSKLRSAARRYKDNHPEEFPQADVPFEADPQDLGVEFQEEGNVGHGSSLSTQITCPEEQAEAAGIDMDEWMVPDEGFTVTTYDGWRADTQKNLVWKDRAIDHGYVKSGGIITKTLWSVECDYVRRKPEPLRPTFAPIECPVTYPEPKPPKDADLYRALLGSDAHIGFEKNVRNAKLVPFHSRQALSIFLQVARAYQPHFIGLLGDWLDLALWTRKFSRKPEFYMTTEPALQELHWWLRRLREACPNAVIVYIEGNHEVRMPSYVQDNMIAASGLTGINATYPALSIPELLDLESLRIEWAGGYDEGEAVFSPVDWMEWMHGDVARTIGGTAKKVIERAEVERYFGHIHRPEMAVGISADDGTWVSGWSFGGLMHTDGRVPGSDRDNSWRKGFGLLEFGEDPPATATPVPINGHGAVWRGKRFVGESIVPSLRESFPGWNW